MSIDPGEGWRLLEPHEPVLNGDEYSGDGCKQWEAANNWRTNKGRQTEGVPYRRRIELQKPTGDAVEHPSHYTAGPIECIDAIESALTPEQFIGYCRGNAMKYAWRADRKHNAVEDLQKARFYIERELAKRGAK
jgi:hypothetical protein